jgi:multimeric flavodoxin WrbA
MAQAAFDGASPNCVIRGAEEVNHADILNGAGYLFVGPENLAGLSGLMKEMFDRCYYPVLGRIEGRPYATMIAAGSDGEGAQRQIDRVATAWRLRRIADPIIVNVHAQTPEEILAPKELEADTLEKCRELGKAFSEGLRLGIY